MVVYFLVVLASIYIFGHWVAGVATAVLILIWRVLPQREGPPVLALAMTTQWVQVTLGVYYTGFTGRPLEATLNSDWAPMVLLGLGAIVALTVGLALGVRFAENRIAAPAEDAPSEVVSFRILMIIYFAAVAFTGVMQEIAFRYPQFTQAILALTFARLGLMALVFRRLTIPELQRGKLFALLGFEVGLGFTGYFSEFREPLLLAGLALLEGFDRRNREHWITAGALALVLGVATLMWLSVRAEFRRDIDDELYAASRSVRLERIQALLGDWIVETQADESVAEDVDFTVARVWAIYYQALARERIPAVMPHTDGELMLATLRHLVTPRVFFPNKPPLPNDSEFVRRFAGANVAGAEENTTIAFGYAAESYVDFGVPLMFAPAFIFAFLMGAAYAVLLRTIRHRELAISLVTCIFWMNLNMYERAWSKIIGLAVTMLAYLGAVAWLVDRWLLARRAAAAEAADEPPPPQPHFGRANP